MFVMAYLVMGRIYNVCDGLVMGRIYNVCNE